MNESQQFLQAQQKIVDFQQWLMEVLKALAERQQENKTSDKATEQMIRHMENGGKCACLSFPMDDIDFVEELLKSRGITAIEMSSVNPETNRAMRTYIFREEDLKAIQHVADDYLRHLDGKSHELDQETFMIANQDRAFFSAAGLTETEMNIFRENAAKYNMSFLFVKETTGDANAPYRVLADSRENLDRCLTDTYADLIGQEGKDFSQKMERMWQNQNDMMDRLKEAKGPVFIVDADNFNSVLEVTEGRKNREGQLVGKKFRTHYLGIRTENRRDGTTIRTPVDEGTTIDRDLDIHLIDELKQMKRPVILTGEEAEKWLNCQKRDSDNRTLILPDLYADGEKRSEFIDSLQEREVLPVVRPLHAKEERAQMGLKTYDNLPFSIIVALKREQIDGVYTLGNDVAFTKDAEERVRQVMHDVYFKDMEPLDVIADELRFMGRGSGKLHHLEKDEEYVVFDFANQDKVIEFYDTKAIVSDGEETCDLLATDFGVYEEKVAETISQMQTPIMMTKEEYMSKDRDELALSMLMSTRGNAAAQNARTKDAQRLEHFHEIVTKQDEGVLKHDGLSEDERELLERRGRSTIETHEARTVEQVLTREDIEVERDTRYRKQEKKRDNGREREEDENR